MLLPSGQVTVRQACPGKPQATSQSLHCKRLIAGLPTQSRGPHAATRPGFGRQRRSPRRPHRGGRANADGVEHAQFGDACLKGGFITITSIGQHHAHGYTLAKRLTHLRQGDLGLGREGLCLRNTSGFAPHRVSSPVFGQGCPERLPATG